MLLYVHLLLIAAKCRSNPSPSNWGVSSDLLNPKQISSVMFVCLWQVLWRHPAFHPEVRPFHFPATRTTTLTCFDFSSFCLGENTTSKPPPFFFYFWVFCLDCFFYLFFFSLSFLSCSWMFGCVLGLCVFLRVCVFSPAASVDYGSFADRCSTWLELLRLKAHTIRRGSVKTSRRTHSLAHSSDHTCNFTSSSCIRARMHPHTPPCMPLGAEH